MVTHRRLVGGVVMALLAVAAAQFPEDSALFDQEVERGGEHLNDLLKNHPDLEDTYFPLKYSIPTQFYRVEEPTSYTMNVIFDPCRGHAFDCCRDTYGTPEFSRVQTEGDNKGQDVFTNFHGETLVPPFNPEASRAPTNALILDEDCETQADPDHLLECVGERVRRTNFSMTPFCWNYQSSIVAAQDCRAPHDGSRLPQCLELGFTQTAYIVECGGKFQDDSSCGTFLEIHRPGNETILAETKLRGQLTSGYRMTVISTTYKGNASRTLCIGDHELWWVMRTRYDWVVQKVIPFRIVSPRCEWDPVNDHYFEYAITDRAEPIYNLNPFDPDRFLPDLTLTKVTGTPGYPGKGMGSTLILLAEGEEEQVSGELPGINELEWEPETRPTIEEFEQRYGIDLDEAGMPVVDRDDN